MSKKYEKLQREHARHRADVIGMHRAIREGERDYARSREQFEGEREVMAELTPALCARNPRAEALRRHFMARARLRV